MQTINYLVFFAKVWSKAYHEMRINDHHTSKLNVPAWTICTCITLFCKNVIYCLLSSLFFAFLFICLFHTFAMYFLFCTNCVFFFFFTTIIDIGIFRFTNIIAATVFIALFVIITIVTIIFLWCSWQVHTDIYIIWFDIWLAWLYLLCDRRQEWCGTHRVIKVEVL